ncbi:MAG: hypothetical protein RIS70_2970 [Planctomycetota bacterium]|jgi:anti-anti-sigma factor
MQVTVTQATGYVLAKTDGKIDESARDVFREQLHPLVGQSGSKMVIDLSGSPRIDSRGVGCLVALVADANTSGSRVVFCNLQPFVSGVIGVTRLDKFFEIATTEAEASSRF